MKNFVKSQVEIRAAIGTALLLLAGCGSPDKSVDGLTLVNGNAIFGTQCPYGTLSKPLAATLNLWDCPMGLEAVDLVQPLRPIVLQADCKKKLILARTLDGALDTSWEVFPDGTFSFTVDGGNAILGNDGKGNSNCAVPLAAELSGRLDCTDRDRVKITVESIWWLDKQAPNPSPRPSVSPTVSPTSTATPTPTPTHTSTPIPTVTPTHTSIPTATPTVWPTVIPTHTSTPAPIPVPTGTFTPAPHPTHMLFLQTSSPKCSVPKGCYFYTNMKLNQCE